MKKTMLILLLTAIPFYVHADLAVEPQPKQKESSEEKKGGALGTLEVVSILTLAGASVFLTRRKEK